MSHRDPSVQIDETGTYAILQLAVEHDEINMVYQLSMINQTLYISVRKFIFCLTST